MLKKINNRFITLLSLAVLGGIISPSTLSSSTAFTTKSFAYRFGQGILNHKKKIGFICSLPILVPALLGMVLAQKKRTLSTDIDWKSYENENQIFQRSINKNNTQLHTAKDGTSYLYHNRSPNNPTILFFSGLSEDARSIERFPEKLQYYLEHKRSYKKLNFLMPILSHLQSNNDDNSSVYQFCTGFGQEADVRKVLRCIKNELLKNSEPIILCARSRGCLVLGHLIELLSTQNHPLLAEYEITEEERKNLLNRIVRICLSVPLVDMKETINYLAGPIFSAAGCYITLPIATGGRYSPLKNKNLINMIQNWNLRKEIPITLILAKEDELVGNKNDQLLETVLRNKFNTVYFCKIDGGHDGEEQDTIIKNVIQERIYTQNSKKKGNNT